MSPQNSAVKIPLRKHTGNAHRGTLRCVERSSSKKHEAPLEVVFGKLQQQAVYTRNWTCNNIDALLPSSLCRVMKTTAKDWGAMMCAQIDLDYI